MDHRWDDDIRREREERGERDRYDVTVVRRDPDVERRDRIARAQPTRPLRPGERRTVNMSPWEIGAAHYNQRDLYTRNARIDDRGYARGPSYHPEEGSYAYHRDEPPVRPDPDAALEPTWPEEHGQHLYTREAWPWLNYEDDAPNVLYQERYHQRDHERSLRSDSRPSEPRQSGWRTITSPVPASVPTHEHGFWHGLKERALGVFSESHRGRGPKGWQRSDNAIREDVCEVLAHHGHLDASDVEVFVKEAEVTLEGTVTDRASKRLAEDLADHCNGVREVHNRLRIRRDDDTNIPFVMPIRAF